MRILSAAREEPAENADVIVVLGSAVWPDEQPSPSLAARTRRGIALFRRGAAPALILTGGTGRWRPSEAEVMRRMMVAAGVPESALALDAQATNTDENLRNARAIMTARGWHRAILVSDPFHLLRAIRIARDMGIQAIGAPATDSPAWLRRRSRVSQIAREVSALMGYTLRRCFRRGH
jgi:uncharacterized SAM-binding protein YcdF (DUF218 family)